MTAADLIAASLDYIAALAPFALVYAVIACAEQLVGLIRKAAGVYQSRRGGW